MKSFSTLTLALSVLATARAAATSTSAAQRKPSLRERAAALRDAHFGNVVSKEQPHSQGLPPPSTSTRSRGLLQSRDDLKPDTPGVSYHWAGAVVPPPSSDENITSVTATMTLPELTAPEDVRTGPSGEYFLYVWVGIDGLEAVDPGTCNALWQTGFAGQIKNGVTTWWGWVC